MKRLLIAIAMAAAASTGQAVNGQTFQNGPYYASPSWDQKIPTAQRFVVLSNWGNEAVLDRETGLVWQRTPTTQQLPLLFQVLDCYSDTTGGRMGWRLPTPEELLSLADPTQHDPALPAGNPFQLGTTRSFWTVSTVFPPTRTDAGPGLVVGFTDGDVGSTGTDQSFGRWCVRGGSHVLTNFISPQPRLLKEANHFGGFRVPIAGVAQTEVGPLTVSTVFVRFDHRADAGDPLLFETVAFGADQASEYRERYCERASTWGDAEATDARAVAFAEAVWKSCIGS